MKKKLSIVFYGTRWPSLGERLKTVQDFYAPVVELEFLTHFDTDRPVSFVPHPTIPGYLIVDPNWITYWIHHFSKLFGTDGTVFIVPERYRNQTPALFGVNTFHLLPSATIQIFVKEDETITTVSKKHRDAFSYWLEHEIAHYLCAILKIEDKVHDYQKAGTEYKILEDIKKGLELPPVQQALWQRILDAFFGKPIKTCTGCTSLPEPKKDLLTPFCLAIQKHEGWYEGSRSYRNNNPGNTKFSRVGYLPIYGEVKKDKDNFAIFQDYNTGFLYLKNLVLAKARKYPEWDLLKFFGDPLEGYAPDIDNNNSKRYAEVVASSIGVSLSSFRLKDLL